MDCNLLCNQVIEGCLQLFLGSFSIVWKVIQVNDVVCPVSLIDDDIDTIQLLIETRGLME